ncbi:MAG TPA: hypothetical protein PK776_12455 [Flavobacterium sp.]|nr:hypothetical protein [Flavobacterium sp.]
MTFDFRVDGHIREFYPHEETGSASQFKITGHSIQGMTEAKAQNDHILR